MSTPNRGPALPVGLGAGLVTGRTQHPAEPGIVLDRHAESLHTPGTAASGTAASGTAASGTAATVLRCTMAAVAAPGGDGGTTGDLPTLDLLLPAADWTVQWFVSDWGDEFTPRSSRITEQVRLAVTTGRSSKGTHPWVALTAPGLPALVVCPAWSGNWAVDLVPQPGGSLRVTAGISPQDFSRRVAPDRPFVAPPVFLASAADVPAAGAALAAAVSRYVLPRSAWSDAVPVEWNHWWPYEDAEIDAATFVANARVARDLGMDLATLDAGWFGPADAQTFWERVRGDWDDENTARFPAGLHGLSGEVRDLGLGFGVWCEVEAIGPDARVAAARPALPATRAGEPLGYVCMGSPEGREHVRGTLERLVTRTGARWIKIDFNLDPGAGCDRTDHGHDAGDGLYEHYRGLYAVLDDVRGSHPELFVEACSSGGLRIDLGLLAHVHAAFLSDPDWTEFHLQLLWGASQMLPAAAIFHFTESQWRTFHPLQNFDPTTASIETIDTMLRSVALHRFGVSYKLVEWAPEQLERLREHVTVYRRHLVPLVRDHGVIRPLTEQPLREGRGERFPAFQLSAGDRHVVAAFRLPGAPDRATVAPAGLDPQRRYRVTLLGPGAFPSDVPGLDVGGTAVVAGADLSAGLQIVAGGDTTSWLLAIDPMP